MTRKDYRIEDLIDIPLFQTLQDKLNEIYTFPSAIIDNDGNVLTATAWQDLCVKFHRTHPECLKACKASDKYIMDHLGEANPAVTYKCPHGLVDNATPIVICGKHLANYFTGQFFLKPPDMELFRAQAKKYGFDETEYLTAVAKVPIWSKEKLAKYLDFVKGFTEIIAGIGYKNLKEKEARDALQEKESVLLDERRRVERLMEVSPAGIVYVDAEGAITYANRRGEELLGLSTSELTGRTYDTPDWKSTHTDGTKFLAEEEPFSVVKRTKKPVSNVEQIITVPDGRRVTLSVNGAPLLADTGEFLGMVASMEDITERKQAEAARLALENRYRDLFHQANEGLLIMTMDGQIEEVNRAFAGMHGYSMDEIKTMDIRILDVLKANTFADRAAIIRSIKAGETVRFDVEHFHKDGHVIMLAVTTSMIYIDGHPFILGFHQDITDRKKAEAQLNQSHKLLANLTRMVPGVVYQYRLYPDGRSAFPYSSPGMNDIYECTPEEVRVDATPVFGRLHPDDYERVGNSIQESARTLQEFYCEFRVILPRQGLRWRWSQAHPERMEDGGTLWHGIISDITERKKAEEALQLSSKALMTKNDELERFLYTASHDLRTPVVTIQSFMRCLEQDMAASDSARVEKAVKFIKSAADTMVHMLDEVLEMSRVGRVIGASSYVTARAVVDDGMTAVAGRIADRGVIIKVADMDVSLYGDRPRLAEIWQNLIENACKFMGDQPAPCIEIGMRREEQKSVEGRTLNVEGEEGTGRPPVRETVAAPDQATAVFFVRDNGIGIDPPVASTKNDTESEIE